MTKRFVGHLLIKGNDVPRQQALQATYTVYRTQKGRFALHVHTEPGWRFADLEASDDFDETEPQEFQLNGFDTVKELEDVVPRDMCGGAVVPAGGENVELLDI